jgi:hypothetical protein
VTRPQLTDEAVAEEWSDIAYEMWVQQHPVRAPVRRRVERARLRERFHAALGELHRGQFEIEPQSPPGACDHPQGTGTICNVCGGDTAALMPAETETPDGLAT